MAMTGSAHWQELSSNNDCISMSYLKSTTALGTSYLCTTAALVILTCALSLQVVIAYAIGTAAALAGFWACPNQPSAQWLAVATVGFFLYGPQMLIGLCGAEVVSPSAVGASQGFLGWISYLGQQCLPGSIDCPSVSYCNIAPLSVPPQ